MKYVRIILASLVAVSPAFAAAASAPTDVMKRSTVFIANYDSDNRFVGWGSGFFVDEGIVVTNKHVILDGDWYRVYATGTDDKVNTDCHKKITRSDVKVNLDDDVAYMRAFLPCEHGVMRFAPDPEEGDPVSVIGYPYRGSLEASSVLSVTSGEVTGYTYEGWLGTDAHLDFGNSGGPVVNESEVVGVAVAKGVDADGNFVTGYFIPSSVILDGLLYANDSRFGYTPQSSFSSRSRSSSSSSSFAVPASSSSVSSGGSSVSSSRSSSRSSLSSRISSRPSFSPVFSDVRPTRAGYDAIMSLHARGVISGYPDGSFHPSGSINRAEFVKILIGGFQMNEIRGETHCFRDVADEWFAPYVCAAKRLGWIGGYPDPSGASGQAAFFKPAQNVNRAEAVKIVTEAFGAPVPRLASVPPDVEPGSWYHPFVARGILIGIVGQFDFFRPSENLTREEAAMWIQGAGL